MNFWSLKPWIRIVLDPDPDPYWSPTSSSGSGSGSVKNEYGSTTLVVIVDRHRVDADPDTDPECHYNDADPTLSCKLLENRERKKFTVFTAMPVYKDFPLS